MTMEHWVEGRSECGYGEKGIILKRGNRVLSVSKNEDGIQFMEECDGCFAATYTKEEALKLIDELREWIIEETNSISLQKTCKQVSPEIISLLKKVKFMFSNYKEGTTGKALANQADDLLSKLNGGNK